IEVEHDPTAALVRERDDVAVLVRQRERGGATTGFEHGAHDGGPPTTRKRSPRPSAPFALHPPRRTWRNATARALLPSSSALASPSAPSMEANPPLGTLGRLHRLLRSNWITSVGMALMTL